MNRSPLRFLYVPVVLALLLAAGCSTQQAVRLSPEQGTTLFNVDTVKAGAFDTGKMWTFDYPPVDYFQRTYGFAPSKEWFEKARLGALRLPGCSASFVSGDGLVFSNHHCARGALDAVNKPGENLPDNGFYAPTLADERKVPRMYADQLQLMEDVTDEVVKAFETGKTDEERVANRSAAIAAIEKRYSDKTGLRCNVITFYNGGKYSVYGYKRFTDVRLVFAPELASAFFGGDYDNFTYPRYDLDISFFRVYGDDGKPLNTQQNFFQWSPNGAEEGEPVFVVGNPGRTSRLFTVAQLEYNRDVAYPYVLGRLDEMVRIYSMMIQKHPDMRMEYQTTLFGFSNSQKVYVGRVEGLHELVIMAKKKDFERTFRNAVMNKPELKSQYASVWTDIENVQREKARVFKEMQALTFNGLGRPALLGLASNLVDYTDLLAMSEAAQKERLRGMPMDAYKKRLTSMMVNKELEEATLASHLEFMQSALGMQNAAFSKLLGGMTPGAAAASLLSKTVLTDSQAVAMLVDHPSEIKTSSDPIIVFVVATADRAAQLRQQYSEAVSREQARVQVLGKAVYDIYGTSIPPDATFTLRIADGVVKNYEYNGTLAPVFTTFYGLYDRYYSFLKKDPWAISDRWKNPSSSFDMSTRLNFVSTNDIIGGNSGSAVLNKNLQVVGIAFDGNIESLPGDFIFDDTKNRCVSVHSSGILEALQDVYKADRLAKELKDGKGQ